MKILKKLFALVLSAALLFGIIALPAFAGGGSSEEVGQVIYTVSTEGIVTATVEVTADGEERTLVLSSYSGGYLLDMATDKKLISGTETLSAEVDNVCDRIVASVLDENGKAISAKAVYGTDSTDISYITVNGEKLENFDNQTDKYVLKASSLEVEAFPADGTTSVSIEYKSEPTQALINVTSSRGRKRQIVVSAYTVNYQKTELFSLAYKYGDVTETIDPNLLSTREVTVELPDNVMSVTLDPKAIGDITVMTQDEPVTEMDGITLGQYVDVASKAYPYNRIAVNNLIPIKNEIGTAIVKVSGDGISNDYVITFISRQPRLTEFNYTGAGKDSIKPTFIGGSAINNDNGTISAPDRGWALINVSKKLVGGSIIMMPAANEKTSDSWWQTSGKTGEYFNFKAERGGKIYVLSAGKLDTNTSQWNEAGWGKVNNGSVPKNANGDEYGDNSGPQRRGDKTWNDYETPEYYAAVMQYNSANSTEHRCIDPGVKAIEGTEETISRALMYVYSKSFNADETVSIYHTGRTDTLGCVNFVAIVWDGDDISYGPVIKNTESQETLSPELPSLRSPKSLMLLEKDSLDKDNSVWKDKSGNGNDMSIVIDEDNTVEENGYKIIKTNGCAFPQAVQAALKSGVFTMIFKLSDFDKPNNKFCPIISNGSMNYLIFIDKTCVDKENTAVGFNIGGSTKRLNYTVNIIDKETMLMADLPNGIEKWYSDGVLRDNGQAGIAGTPPSENNFVLGFNNSLFDGTVTFEKLQIFDGMISQKLLNVPKYGSIKVNKDIDSEFASVVLLAHKDDGSSYTVAEFNEAISAGDTDAINKMVLYYGQENAVDGKISPEIFMKAGKGEYTLCINGEEETLNFISEDGKISAIEETLADKSVSEENLPYLCDSIKLNRLSNKANVQKLANGMLSKETSLDENKLSEILDLAILIESLNENANNVLPDDIEKTTGETVVPLSYTDNLKDKEALVTALSGKGFASEKEYKDALCEYLFISVINNSSSKDMNTAAKKNFFEEYASSQGLDLTKYNTQGVDKQSVITQLAAKNCSTIPAMQTELDSLSVVPKEKQNSNTSGGGGGGGGGKISGGGGGSSVAGYGYATDPYEKPEKTDAQPDDETSFSDMEGYEWAENAVSSLVKRGIIKGYSDKTFKPGKSITRAEFVTVIVSEYFPEAIESEQVFDDVRPEDWYFKNVMTAYAEGIIKGVNEKEFMPNKEIKRQDIAVILKNLAEKLQKTLNVSDEEFSDNGEISDYAAEAVYMLRGSGIIKGNGNNIFNPSGYARRAEAAQMISSFIANLGGRDDQ